MSKNLESLLRELFATGYDPVDLKISAAAINEENLDVAIGGRKYTVKGDTLTAVAESRPLSPEEQEQAEHNALIQKVLDQLGATTLEQTDETNDYTPIFTVKDAEGKVLAEGTMQQLEDGTFSTPQPEAPAGGDESAAPAGDAAAGSAADGDVAEGAGASDEQGAEGTGSGERTDFGVIDPNDVDGDGVNDRLQARMEKVLTGFEKIVGMGPLQLRPVDVTGNNVTVFAVVNVAENTYTGARGTLVDLENTLRDAGRETVTQDPAS